MVGVILKEYSFLTPKSLLLYSFIIYDFLISPGILLVKDMSTGMPLYYPTYWNTLEVQEAENVSVAIVFGAFITFLIVYEITAFD